MGGTGQVGYGPLQRIDGPPPVAPPYSLLRAAEAPAAGVRIVPDVDEGQVDAEAAREVAGWGIGSPGRERWLNGVQVYPYPPDVGDVYDPCAAASNQTTKGFGTQPLLPSYGAMTAWLAETCTAARVWNQEEFKARAVAVLAAVESFIVARELMYGIRLPSNPHFSDGDGTFPNGNTATKSSIALGLLEDEIAKSGRLGLIHCTPSTATSLRERFELDNKTGVWRTVTGNVVIPDAGYVRPSALIATPVNRIAPGANQDWMYATGPVDVRRSEIFTTPDTLAEALDRGMGATNGTPNSITYRAERYYLADWDKEVQAAVLVDRTL